MENFIPHFHVGGSWSTLSAIRLAGGDTGEAGFCNGEMTRWAELPKGSELLQNGSILLPSSKDDTLRDHEGCILRWEENADGACPRLVACPIVVIGWSLGRPFAESVDRAVEVAQQWGPVVVKSNDGATIVAPSDGFLEVVARLSLPFEKTPERAALRAIFIDARHHILPGYESLARFLAPLLGGQVTGVWLPDGSWKAFQGNL